MSEQIAKEKKNAISAGTSVCVAPFTFLAVTAVICRVPVSSDGALTQDTAMGTIQNTDFVLIKPKEVPVPERLATMGPISLNSRSRAVSSHVPCIPDPSLDLPFPFLVFIVFCPPPFHFFPHSFILSSITSPGSSDRGAPVRTYPLLFGQPLSVTPLTHASSAEQFFVS